MTCNDKSATHEALTLRFLFWSRFSTDPKVEECNCNPKYSSMKMDTCAALHKLCLGALTQTGTWTRWGTRPRSLTPAFIWLFYTTPFLLQVILSAAQLTYLSSHCWHLDHTCSTKCIDEPGGCWKKCHNMHLKTQFPPQGGWLWLTEWLYTHWELHWDHYTNLNRHTLTGAVCEFQQCGMSKLTLLLCTHSIWWSGEHNSCPSCNLSADFSPLFC